MDDPYELVGSNTSPYSRKLHAILRYRRIPHVWRLRRMNMSPAIEAVRPQLMPMLRFPGTDQYRVDSTPLAYALEQRHPQARSILPPDPADQFICHLIEDFADEWCTKMMYYLRWVEEPTARFAATWIIQDWMPDAIGSKRTQMEQMIYERQRKRLELVAGQGNGDIIKADFHALLDILGPYLSGSRFLFGNRPSLADFAIYGQLTTMIVDPLPQAMIRERAPGLEFWVFSVDDASGIEGEWQPALPAAAMVRRQLLEIVGRSYLPFLAANATALDADREQFELEIGSKTYRQAPFGYQAKCYAEIRARWSALADAERASLSPLLDETGCLNFLAD